MTSRYLSAVGSVRVLETKLLQSSHIEKMLGAKNLEVAFATLYDLDFGQFIESGAKPENFEQVLQRGLYEYKISLTRLAEKDPILQIIWLQYDLANAKLLLKLNILGQEQEFPSKMWIPYGDIPRRTLEECLRGESATQNAWISSAFQEARKVYEASCDPLQMEQVLDRAFFQKIHNLVEKSCRPVLKKFIETFVDGYNILASLRSLLQGGNSSSQFLPGGSIPSSSFQVVSQEELISRLPTFWKHAVTVGLDRLQKSNDITPLEQRVSSMIHASLDPAKCIIDGPEPLVALFLRKERDSKILRTILTAKRIHLPETEIRNMISSFFIT